MLVNVLYSVSLKWGALATAVACVAAILLRHRPQYRLASWAATAAGAIAMLLAEIQAGPTFTLPLGSAPSHPAARYALVLAPAAYGFTVALLVGTALARSVALRLAVGREHLPLDSAAAARREALRSGADVRLASRLRLRITPEVPVPTTTGLLSPVVLLPDFVRGQVYRDYFHTAVLHEVIRLLRFDQVWRLLGSTVATVLFFHPLAWVVRYEIARAAAEATDDWHCHIDGDRRPLAAYLEQTAAAVAHGRPGGLRSRLALAARLCHHRLGRLTSPGCCQPPAPARAGPAAAVVLAACVVLSGITRAERATWGWSPAVAAWGAADATLLAAPVLVVHLARRRRHLTARGSAPLAGTRMAFEWLLRHIDRELELTLLGELILRERRLLVMLALAAGVGTLLAVAMSRAG